MTGADGGENPRQSIATQSAPRFARKALLFLDVYAEFQVWLEHQCAVRLGRTAEIVPHPYDRTRKNGERAI